MVRLHRKGWVSGRFPEHRESFMKSQKIANSIKNAMGTVFLLAGAFFVCSTLLSMRAVLADPIAPVEAAVMAPQATVAGATSRATNGRATATRANPRGNANTSRTTVARTATNVSNARATTSRNVSNARANSSARNVSNARAVSNRAVASRGTSATSRGAVSSRANASGRNVVSRGNAVTNRANASNSRTVRARTATTDAASNARISLQGSAIRGSKTNATTTYSYLSSKLYTGNYSNIIDSSTGLISNEAFTNCMESYYTCMDEICTARNVAQRRCACAGRVKAFAEAETALESANEELIKVSGELALLIANKGKDVSDAFQLTEAEQVMNCVS